VLSDFTACKAVLSQGSERLVGIDRALWP
jgi:hypothetical protein